MFSVIRRMWNNFLTGLFGLNLMVFLIQDCTGALLFNLYIPYGYSPLLPSYFYAITPGQPRIQLPHYPVSTTPLTIAYNVAPATTSLNMRQLNVPQQKLDDLRSYVAYGQQRPVPQPRTIISDYSDDPMEDPSCKLSSWPDNVCDDDSAYPLELIQDILEENYILTPDWPTEMKDSSIITRGIDGGGDDQSSCDAESRIIYPRVARSSKNKWVYVANYDDYLQPVRVRKCSSTSRSCSPRTQSTYRSKCEQDTRRLTMVAIDVKRRKPYKETFEMPVECQCAVLSSVFPTRSNRPGSQPPPLFPINATSANHVSRPIEERTRRRH